jgi:hypothetical protein
MPRRFALTAALAITCSIAACGAAAASNLVLGSPTFAGTGAEGWGNVAPHRIYNGGDPSGLVKEIQWTSWGGRVAIGYGLGWIFKPHGGYYSRPLLVELRAQALGHCGSQPAYTQLAIRWPSKPEASLGSWRLWSEARSLCHL